MPDFRDLTLYVVRHGETEHNVAGRWTGRADSPLTAKGRDQAAAIGRMLRADVPDDLRLDFVSSPLHRACVTMELMREAAGLETCGYRTDPRLMENDCGQWSGLTTDEIILRDAAHFARRTSDVWNWAAPGGESLATQYATVGAFLKTLSSDAVLVCHGMTSRLIRGHVLGLAPEQMIAYEQGDVRLVRLRQGGETLFEDQ